MEFSAIGWLSERLLLTNTVTWMAWYVVWTEPSASSPFLLFPSLLQGWTAKANFTFPAARVWEV